MPTIVLNNNNIVSITGNNKFVYEFAGGGVRFADNNDIALGQMSLYYSWFNISASNYKNNTYSYTWVDGSTVNISMPDGLYSVAELNAYLQNIMVSNTHYLIDNNGDYVYYLNLNTNATYYSVQFTAYPVPSALPLGWSLPVAATWALPVAAVTPQLTIFQLDTISNFGYIIGFNAGTYPTPVQSTVYSKLSDFAPQVSPVSSVTITCSLITNPYSPQSKILYSFGLPAVAFGQQIQITPPELIFNRITAGNYNSFVVDIIDQENRPIPINDPQTTILLVIRSSGENQ